MDVMNRSPVAANRVATDMVARITSSYTNHLKLLICRYDLANINRFLPATVPELRPEMGKTWSLDDSRCANREDARSEKNRAGKIAMQLKG